MRLGPPVLLLMCMSIASMRGAGPVPDCAGLQGRYDDVRAHPQTGDSWLDLKSAFLGLQARIVDNSPEPGSSVISYEASDGCRADFHLRDSRITSKSFKVAASVMGEPAAAGSAPGAADEAARIRQIEAALQKLKADTARLEAMLAEVRKSTPTVATKSKRPATTGARAAAAKPGTPKMAP